MMRNNCNKWLAVIVLVCGLVVARGAAWNMERDLPRQLTDISNRLGRTSSFESKQALADDLQNINYEISQALLSADSPDWGNPSPKRRAIIERAATLISPYNRLLLEMAFDVKKSGLDSVSRQCLSLLDYTKLDAQFRESIGQQARTNLGAGLEPFRLLYEHHALDKSMRKLAAERIRGELDARRKTNMALASAEMGFEEAVPICEQLLSKPFTSEGVVGPKGILADNELSSGYRRAAGALLYLGPKAKPLLPLLIQRRDEIIRALGPKGSGIFVGGLEGAMDCLEGRRPVNFLTAVNGSGRLDTN